MTASFANRKLSFNRKYKILVVYLCTKMMLKVKNSTEIVVTKNEATCNAILERLLSLGRHLNHISSIYRELKNLSLRNLCGFEAKRDNHSAR